MLLYELQQGNEKMQIGKIYNVAFTAGRYEIEYERSVKCIRKTPSHIA